MKRGEASASLFFDYLVPLLRVYYEQKNPFDAYIDIDSSHLSDADFEKKWYESVIMILQRIQATYYNPVEAHIKLIEIGDGLGWIQENLNEKLSSQHRTMLKSI